MLLYQLSIGLEERMPDIMQQGVKDRFSWKHVYSGSDQRFKADLCVVRSPGAHAITQKGDVHPGGHRIERSLMNADGSLEATEQNVFGGACADRVTDGGVCEGAERRLRENAGRRNTVNEIGGGRSEFVRNLFGEHDLDPQTHGSSDRKSATPLNRLPVGNGLEKYGLQIQAE
jgi:hypothetical protein